MIDTSLPAHGGSPERNRTMSKANRAVLLPLIVAGPARASFGSIPCTGAGKSTVQMRGCPPTGPVGR